MLKTEKKVKENTLRKAFESGYHNAATALSVVVKDKVLIHDFHDLQCPVPVGKNSSTLDTVLANHQDSTILVTTELFGEIFGKSYLLLTQDVIDALANGNFSVKNQLTDIKIEFIKELDNILSAAVISKLSDQLNLKMYGDVPNWLGKYDGSIKDRINDDFERTTEEVYINSAWFSMDSHPLLRPLFIWVIDNKNIQPLNAKFTQ